MRQCKTDDEAEEERVNTCRQADRQRHMTHRKAYYQKDVLLERRTHSEAYKQTNSRTDRQVNRTTENVLKKKK